LLNSKSGNYGSGGVNDVNDTYFISAPLVPNPGGSVSAGSFTFGGSTVDVTADMTLGAPTGMQTHGIFDTYYKEFSFNFNSSDKALAYNTQDNPAGPTADSSGTFYYAAFQVDASGLAAGYGIHFDLYSKNESSGAVDKVAPFSHDAQTAVPETVTMLLLGSGLVGLVGLVAMGRRKTSA
jgi:hypothetical protein